MKIQAYEKKGDAFDQQDHLHVVDALRGYAVLLVIAVHSLPHTKDLVWPAKRLQLLGVHGVQLFFMASALTLLMSWRRSGGTFGIRCMKFFTRRFFRIAPLYYLAIIFYWFVNQKTSQDFSFGLLNATLLFYNAWSPYLIPTVPGWMPVPGGWSIGVEFCFYFVFPFLAITVNTMRRSVVFFCLALAIMISASTMGMHMYPEISLEQRSNFLYFWPLNQLVIFALGFLLYHCVKSEAVTKRIAESKIDANGATVILAVFIVLLSLMGTPKFFDWSTGMLPTHLIMSMAFLPWAIVLVNKPTGIVINPVIVSIGKVSFSAYVLHFSIYGLTSWILAHTWPFPMTGIISVFYAATLIVMTVLLTWYVSSWTYKYIEQPFIGFGKRLSVKLSRKAPVPDSLPT